MEPVAYITKAGLENWLNGDSPESHVLLRTPGNMRAALYTSVKDGGGEERNLTAEEDQLMRQSIIASGTRLYTLPPTGSDAVADGAREKQASDAPIWMSATAAGAWADGYNACLEALRSDVAPVKAVGSEALREARIAELEAVVANVRSHARTMRKGATLVGPKEYANDPKSFRAWRRALYHEGKELMGMTAALTPDRKAQT